MRGPGRSAFLEIKTVAGRDGVAVCASFTRWPCLDDDDDDDGGVHLRRFAEHERGTDSHVRRWRADVRAPSAQQ